MARNQHLPIYKTGYELLGQVVRATKEFPREQSKRQSGRPY